MCCQSAVIGRTQQRTLHSRPFLGSMWSKFCLRLFWRGQISFLPLTLSVRYQIFLSVCSSLLFMLLKQVTCTSLACECAWASGHFTQSCSVLLTSATHIRDTGNRCCQRSTVGKCYVQSLCSAHGCACAFSGGAFILQCSRSASSLCTSRCHQTPVLTQRPHSSCFCCCLSVWRPGTLFALSY